MVPCPCWTPARANNRRSRASSPLCSPHQPELCASRQKQRPAIRSNPRHATGTPGTGMPATAAAAAAGTIIYTIYTIYTNKFTYIHRYAYTCMHLQIYYRYSFECSLFFGGAYLLEDGLAPCGGEGWAPPHARARKRRCFTLAAQCACLNEDCLTIRAAPAMISVRSLACSALAEDCLRVYFFGALAPRLTRGCVWEFKNHDTKKTTSKNRDTKKTSCTTQKKQLPKSMTKKKTTPQNNTKHKKQLPKNTTPKKPTSKKHGTNKNMQKKRTNATAGAGANAGKLVQQRSKQK